MKQPSLMDKQFGSERMYENTLRRLFAISIIAVLTVIVFSNWIAVAMAADDVNLTLEGHFGGVTYATAVSGNYAYIGQGQDLVVIDISNPSQPLELGRIHTLGLIYDIKISGSYAYVADWDYGLVIVDISNPAAPTLAGSYDTAGYASGAAEPSVCSTGIDSSGSVQQDAGYCGADLSNADVSDKWAVLVGIADYYGTDNDLSYPAKDATDMRSALINNGWQSEHIRVLLNSSATKSGIQDAIENWLGPNVSADDTVIFFYSGHGTYYSESQYNPDGDNETDGKDEYLCSYSETMEIEDFVADGELDQYLDTLASEHIAVIIDSCFSGGMTKAMMVQSGRETIELPTSNKSPMIFSWDVVNRASPKTMKKPMVQIIDGLSKDIGQDNRVVLMACDDDESSMEISGLENGVFAHYIIEGFQCMADANSDGCVSAEEAFDYAEPLVAYLVGELGQSQHPQMYDSYTGDLQVTSNLSNVLITVDDSGSADYTSIQDAVDAAESCDTVYIYSGTYTESVLVNKPITLQGEGTGVVTINGGGSPGVLMMAHHASVAGLAIEGAGSYSGIELGYTRCCNISGNNVSNNGCGIGLTHSSDNKIADNICNGNTKLDGVSLWYSCQNNSIINNTVNSNRWSGVYLHSGCNNNSIVNNTANSNRDPGIYLIHSSNNNILTGNIANSNNNHGIKIEGSHDNTITKNTANTNNHRGIYLDRSCNNVLIDNTAQNNAHNLVIEGDATQHYYQTIDTTNTVNGRPVYYLVEKTDVIIDETSNAGYVGLVSCGNITVKGLNLMSNGDGILLVNSTDSMLDNNSAPHNMYGIRLVYSNNNTLNSSNISHNTYNGIHLDHSDSNSINDMEATSNGKDGIHIESSNNNKISGVGASSNGDDGIELCRSDNNIIKSNELLHNDYGIYLYYSDNNIIYDIAAIANEEDGFNIWSSNNNKISCNNASSNSDNGIYLYYSHGNVLTHNDAPNNYCGIHLVHSSGSSLVNNIVCSNDAGIYLQSSDNNLIYHNNLTNNDEQAYDDGDTTSWDNGPIIGGNYWDDYNGTDPDDDGIGDTPYVIDANSQDEYPLMSSSEGLDKVIFITHAQTDRLGYGTNENILIDCIVQDDMSHNVTVDHVYASIKKPDSHSEQISLDETTTGNYNGIFVNSSLAGSYSITIHATMVGAVNDTAELSFEVASSFIEGWIVNETEIHCNEIIILNGDLTIENGGNLTLRNVILRMNCDYDGQHHIEVKDGGAFYIYDNDNDPTTTEDASVITALNSDYGYLFWVNAGSTFRMNNSELYGCGYEYNSPTCNHAGLWINSNDVAIEDNLITNNYNGVLLYSSSNNTLANNTINFNDRLGVYLRESDNNAVNNCDISHNGGDGIYLYYSDNNTIYDIAAILNEGDGVYIERSNNNKISGINASSNGDDGINFECSHYNNISESTITLNEDDGVYLVYSDNNNITSNNASMHTNDAGIYVNDYSDNNMVHNNTVNNNGYGIRLDRNSGNNISNNSLNNNSYIGFRFYSSESYYNNIEDNRVNGDVYYHYVNEKDITIQDITSIADDPSNLGWVSIINCTDIHARNLTLANNDYNGYGLFIYETENSTFEDINASKNRYGVYLKESDNNTIKSSNVSHNTRHGVYLSSSSNNTINNNNFNNIVNLYFTGTIYSNNWNTAKTPSTNIVGGSYLGGNFWAKPDGTGFSQTCTDTDVDGICDLSYTLASDNVDYLPLAAPDATQDITSPTLIFTSPTNGSTVTTPTITVSGTASDVSGIANVTVNGIHANGTTNWSANITLTEGINNITVIATDTAGNNATKTITVIYDFIDNTPPAIQITTPINGSTINIFNNTVSGTISDSSELASAALYLNSQHVTDLTSGAFNVKVDYVPNATNNISVYAEDIYNNSNLSWSLVNVLLSSTTTTTTVPANNSTTIDMRDEADTLIELSTGNNSAAVTINITASTNASDISAVEANVSYGLAPAQHSLGRYIRVNVTGDRANITRVNLSMYYSESDLDIDGDGAADLNASTLTMYWYDANNTIWMPLAPGINYSSLGGPVVFGSGHNSTGQYIWADLNHFSCFALAANITRSEHICNLQSGWNMISVPVMPIGGANVNDIFGGNVTTVFGWTGTRYQQIGISDELVPKEAYWMLSNTGYNQPITGTPPADTSHTLSAGWNMVGPVSGGVSVDSLSNVTTVFGWTGTRYVQITGTQELEQTKGYWMLAGQDTVIQI